MNPLSRGRCRWVLLLLTAWIPIGCSVSEHLLAGRHDYRNYREFRLARAPVERLRHANRYLQDVRRGRFRSEVAAWFAQNEPAFYALARDRPSLLRAYLAAMPDGPRSEQAIDRLLELETLREYRDRQALRERETLARLDREFARARAERESVVASITDYLRLLSEVRSFGRPVEDLGHELMARLRSSDPHLACSQAICKKSVQMSYAVPEAKRLAPRSAVFEVELRLERGQLGGIAFKGPELFSRLFEASSLEPVRASDLSARVRALAKVTELVEGLIEPKLSASRCGKEAVSPTLLRRECDGIVLELVAGAGPGDPDRLTLGPTRRRAFKHGAKP